MWNLFKKNTEAEKKPKTYSYEFTEEEVEIIKKAVSRPFTADDKEYAQLATILYKIFND